MATHPRRGGLVKQPNVMGDLILDLSDIEDSDTEDDNSVISNILEADGDSQSYGQQANDAPYSSIERDQKETEESNVSSLGKNAPNDSSHYSYENDQNQPEDDDQTEAAARRRQLTLQYSAGGGWGDTFDEYSDDDDDEDDNPTNVPVPSPEHKHTIHTELPRSTPPENADPTRRAVSPQLSLPLSHDRSLPPVSPAGVPPHDQSLSSLTSSTSSNVSSGDSVQTVVRAPPPPRQEPSTGRPRPPLAAVGRPGSVVWPEPPPPLTTGQLPSEPSVDDLDWLPPMPDHGAVNGQQQPHVEVQNEQRSNVIPRGRDSYFPPPPPPAEQQPEAQNDGDLHSRPAEQMSYSPPERDSYVPPLPEQTTNFDPQAAASHDKRLSFLPPPPDEMLAARQSMISPTNDDEPAASRLSGTVSEEETPRDAAVNARRQLTLQYSAGGGWGDTFDEDSADFEDDDSAHISDTVSPDNFTKKPPSSNHNSIIDSKNPADNSFSDYRPPLVNLPSFVNKGFQYDSSDDILSPYESSVNTFKSNGPISVPKRDPWGANMQSITPRNSDISQRYSAASETGDLDDKVRDKAKPAVHIAMKDPWGTDVQSFTPRNSDFSHHSSRPEERYSDYSMYSQRYSNLSDNDDVTNRPVSSAGSPLNPDPATRLSNISESPPPRRLSAIDQRKSNISSASRNSVISSVFGASPRNSSDFAGLVRQNSRQNSIPSMSYSAALGVSYEPGGSAPRPQSDVLNVSLDNPPANASLDGVLAAAALPAHSPAHSHAGSSAPSSILVPHGTGAGSINRSRSSMNRSRSSMNRSVTFAGSEERGHGGDCSVTNSTVDSAVSRSVSLLTAADPRSARRAFHRHLAAYSAAFFLLFSAFIGLAVVQASINGQVGVVSLALLFLVSLPSCLLLSPVASALLGSKPTVLACCAGFAAWQLANLYPHWATLIPASIACGAAYGCIWAAQATHFTELSVNLAEILGEAADAVIARAFGLFFCFLLLGTSFGCLVTSVFISFDLTEPGGPTTPTPSLPASPSPLPPCGPDYCPRPASYLTTSHFSPAGYFLSMSQMNSGGANVTVAVAGSVGSSSPAPTPGARVTDMYALVGIHSACTIAALLIIALFVRPMPVPKYADSAASEARRSVASILHQLARRRQLLMTPLNVYAGLSKSLVLAEIAQAWVGCSLGVEMIGYTTAAYGVSACCAAVSGGFLLKRTRRAPIFTTALCVAAGMLLFLLLWPPDPQFTAAFFLIPAMWAVSDGLLVSQINAFYGFMFQSSSWAAFAVFRFWEGLGLVSGYALTAAVCVSTKLYLMLALVAAGTAGYVLTELHQAKLEKLHRHVKLTFLEATATAIQTADTTRNRVNHRPAPQSHPGGVFNVSGGVFESSI